MQLSEPHHLIAALAAAERRLVVVSTGGGSLVVPSFAATPGASEVTLAAHVPSSRMAVDRMVGGPQESYCSSKMARRLAAAAWQEACLLQSHAPEAARRAVGLAITGSLKTTRPKRGCHRVHAAVQTLEATATDEIVLVKDARSRADEEMVAAAMAIDLLAEACGLSPECRVGVESLLRPGESVIRDGEKAQAAWRHLLDGTRTVTASTGDDGPVAGGLVFPGSFDPLHEGHRLMARIAEEIAERPVAYEISVTNVDKPMLDYVSIRDRAAQFNGQRLWLTRAATFVEKLDVFPESTFVMGADTYARLADPRYYGGSAATARSAVETIASRARGLIVFGRTREGVFEDATQIEAPEALRDISYFVSQREFRLDISSTELRRQDAERRESCNA